MVYTKKIYKFLTLFSPLLLLVSCSSKTQVAENILTQKTSSDSKIPLTVSVKYGIYLDEFEKAVEEEFTELDLIQVGNYTANFSEEYEQQLANDDLTDIIITWPLDKAALNCEDRLIDLSGMEFTSRYNLSALNTISKSGKLYYLPGPTQVRGILFNKTMFEENGWAVPSNFEEFVSLCQTIEASGIRSLQLTFWNKEVLRYAFIGFSYSESFSSPTSAQALNNYNIGKGSLRDFALPAFETFERLAEAGIFRPEDLDVRYPDREQMLFNRQCAMVSDSVSMIELAKNYGCTDEFAIMPFFCPGADGGWGHLIPNQYIGLNQNLTNSENKEKYDLVLRVMDYISTPKGQLALAGNNRSMISSLVSGSKQISSPELQPLEKTINKGQYAIFPSFTNTDTILYDALAAMLRKEIDRDEAIYWVDKENQNPQPRERAAVIGTATETFSLEDTGAYVTDVLRTEMEADIALFLDNGKDGKFNARGISAKFYQGEIRESDVMQRILPTLQHGEMGYINLVTITGENLYNVLEYALPDGNWFYYFSGLKMTYDPTAEPGTRIKALTDEHGKPLDLDKIYTVAIMEGTVDEQWIETCKPSELLVKDLIINDIKEKGSISPSKDGRLQMISK